jgi:outer membrane receptor protein involved in Fe transport
VGRIELRPPVGERLSLRIGGDGRVTSGRTNERFTFVAGNPTRQRAAGGRTTTLGGFAEAAWEPDDRLTLTAGGRIDRWWIRRGFLREATIATGAVLTNSRFADRSGWEPTGAAASPGTPPTRSGCGRQDISAGGCRRSTSFTGRFGAGADATAANAALSPERLRGIDGGIDWRPAAQSFGSARPSSGTGSTMPSLM